MNGEEKDIFNQLGNITDPEVPVLTILDLGIVRQVRILEWDARGKVQSIEVVITPTYSGCPAMDVISMQIRMLLGSMGIKKVNIQQQLQPAWTTDWMTTTGKEKLENYGIAAPQFQSKHALHHPFHEVMVPCPKCKSGDTELVSNFSGTACKALYRCEACKEPFEYFKCH